MQPAYIAEARTTAVYLPTQFCTSSYEIRSSQLSRVNGLRQEFHRWWRAQKRAAANAAVNPTAASHQQYSTAELRRRLLITFLEVTFYYFPSLLTSTLELFACFHIDPAADPGFHNAQVLITFCAKDSMSFVHM